MQEKHQPLESNWINRDIELVVEGQAVSGTVRANWGAIEVAITSPIAHLSRGHDARRWRFTVLAVLRLETRYVCRGELTRKGQQEAERFLAGMYLDWLAVRRHEARVCEHQRLTQQKLKALSESWAGQRRTANERLALRRSFKAGRLAQHEYQPKLRPLRKELGRLKAAERDAKQAIFADFAKQMQQVCGREIRFEEVERLLWDVAVIVACSPVETDTARIVETAKKLAEKEG